jgi:hypothetical protein
LVSLADLKRIRRKPTLPPRKAPGDGIIIHGNGVSFSGASNLIVRYLRIYMGHLRQKLEVDPTLPRYLLTETGTCSTTICAVGA